MKFWNVCIYTRIPKVAPNDIQKPASITAHGENPRISAPATDNEVKESALYEQIMERYTISSIIIERVADIENPVNAR